jgi:hypothetical protein
MEYTALPTPTVQVDQSTISILTRQEKTTKIIDTNIDNWKRRLDTHEDPFNLHKWAGLGWLISLTLILASGTLSSFAKVPSMLEPVTYLFVIATIAQSLTSIPMAIKHPDVGTTAVALIMFGDTLYSLYAFGDVKDIMHKINEMDPIKDTNAISDKFIEAFGTVPPGLLLNVAMLQQLWVHATNTRTDFLNILESRGSSLDMVF